MLLISIALEREDARLYLFSILPVICFLSRMVDGFWSKSGIPELSSQWE